MLKKIGIWWNTTTKIVYFIGAVCSIILFIVPSFREKIFRFPMLVGKFVNLLLIYWDILVPVVFGMFFAMVIAWLYLRFRRVEQKIGGRIVRRERYNKLLFKDDFKADLEKNWEYEGEWRIDSGELRITRSERGGITRVGHQWDDYSFHFTGIIVNQFIGWLVRAQDLFNYYMLQINISQVRPHVCLGGNFLLIEEKPHGLRLRQNKPVHVRTEVRGLGISIFINKKKIYNEERFFSREFLKHKTLVTEASLTAQLPFRKGRVGFRLSAQENGTFYRCRVLSPAQENIKRE